MAVAPGFETAFFDRVDLQESVEMPLITPSRPMEPQDGRGHAGGAAENDPPAGKQPALKDYDRFRAKISMFGPWGAPPPLVLKSDNDSVFKSEGLGEVLIGYVITSLLSRLCPLGYNGGCEAAGRAIAWRQPAPKRTS